MDYVDMSEAPDLDNAILIGAFAGWNDAASAATWAVKFLINHWEATPVAEIQPETFFDFSETRPQVRITSGTLRRLSWPTNRFYAHRAERRESPSQQRDIVLLLGEEPQLRWQTFARAVLDVCHACHVSEIVLFGALVGEVPHTAPVHIFGTASAQAILRRMDRATVERASYEGQTGMLTVLHDAARKDGLGAASLWGTAPHYVSATPNLPVSAALLTKLDEVYHFDLRLSDLARAARRFTARVSSLVAADPEVSAYVRELEQRTPDDTVASSGTVIAGETSGIHHIPVDGELPSPEEAIKDVEEWLRQFRGESGRDV
jgi:predicted ATP-grasp superfamily ATP-dependent carboligase